MKNVTARIYSGKQYSMLDVECDTPEEAIELINKYHGACKPETKLFPVAPIDGTTFQMNELQWTFKDGKWDFKEAS